MPVTASDIEVKLGRALTPDEILRVQSDIADAYALAASRGWLSDPVTAGQDVVIKAVVLRAFGSPAGSRVITQESLGSRSVSYSDRDGRYGLYFTAEDIAALGGARSRVYSVRLTTPQDHR